MHKGSCGVFPSQAGFELTPSDLVLAKRINDSWDVALQQVTVAQLPSLQGTGAAIITKAHVLVDVQHIMPCATGMPNVAISHVLRRGITSLRPQLQHRPWSSPSSEWQAALPEATHITFTPCTPPCTFGNRPARSGGTLHVHYNPMLAAAIQRRVLQAQSMLGHDTFTWDNVCACH